MRVAVTGAAGFVGSAVCRALVAAGHSVHAIDDLSTGRREWLPPGVTFDHNDAAWGDYDGVDAIVHAAAYADISRNWSHDEERSRVWTCGPPLTWAALEQAPVGCRFIFLSSACLYDGVTEPGVTRATSIYAASKLAGEALVDAHAHASRIQGTALRLVSCVGRNYWHGHIADFVRQAMDGGTVHALDDGSQRKSYVHVDDVGDAVVKALHEETSRRGLSVWNVSSRERWSWRDTIDVMRETRPVDVVPGPGRSAWVGDPLDLDVYGYGDRSVCDGVREALVSLGWRDG